MNQQQPAAPPASHLVDDKYSIRDLVDLERLRSVFEKFSRATGCTIGFISYPDQEILLATGWRDICTAFHRANPESARVCRESNIAMTSKATREGVVVVEPCDHGLVDGGVPVIIKGTRLATLATGQVFFQPPDLGRFQKQAQRFGYDPDKYLAAVRQVPVVDEARFRATLAFLGDLAMLIAQMGYSGLELRDKAESLAQEIAERKRAQDAGRRLTRELRAVSACNQVLVRASDEQTLLDEVCRIIVGTAGYRMVWVGFAEHDDYQSVRAAAWAGYEAGYLREARLTWADVERGRGPTGTAIRTGKLQVVHDTQTDPCFTPWREQALRHGYGSVIVLPLVAKGQAFGCVNLYSAAPGDFSDDEVKMLWELADDLAYGITALRTRAAHNLAESELAEYRQNLEEMVEQRIAQLNEANAHLRAEIIERTRAEEDLRRSHEELQSAQLLLIEAAKAESIGTLAAGVAHEVKNPLGIILMGVEVLDQRLRGGDPALLTVLEDIRNAVERADKITRGLLDYAAVSRLDLRPEAINRVLRQALHLMHGQLVTHHIDVREDLAPDLPPVLIDAQKMEQVFLNLLVNALQAMPQGGTVRVRSYATVCGEGGVSLSGPRLDEPWYPGEALVAVDIDDSGPGIPQENLSRIFDPFFTTKAPGQGTGLGLPVTRSIVELHGGAIEVRNIPGGARVTVYLKVHEGDSHVSSHTGHGD